MANIVRDKFLIPLKEWTEEEIQETIDQIEKDQKQRQKEFSAILLKNDTTIIGDSLMIQYKETEAELETLRKLLHKRQEWRIS